MLHGNAKSSVITADFLHGADYEALSTAGKTFKGLVSASAIVRRGEGERAKETAVSDFRQAMAWLLQQAEAAVARQRYKGLGEMNPAQLWETTMDPTVRRLLRVQIDDAIKPTACSRCSWVTRWSHAGNSSKRMRSGRRTSTFDRGCIAPTGVSRPWCRAPK